MTVDIVENYYVISSEKDLTSHGFLKSKTGNYGILKSKESKKLILTLFPNAKFPVVLKKNSPITRDEIDNISWEKLCKIPFPESDK